MAWHHQRDPNPQGPEQILWGRMTPLSLAALGAAFALGIYGFSFEVHWVHLFAGFLQPLGALWIAALRMTVIPLVLTQLLAALTGPSASSGLGFLGLRTFGLFALFLGAVGLGTVLLMPPVIEAYSVNPEAVVLLQEDISIPPSALAMMEEAPSTLGEWVQTLVPSNVFEAAAEGHILPLLFFTLLFGLAASKQGEESRAQLGSLFSGLAEVMMKMVFWILWITPLAVFVLVLNLCLNSGAAALGLLLFYVVVVTGWMLFVSGLFYPVSALLGGVSLAQFAKGVAPAQMVAVSTRSSLASLPALIEGGKDHLGFPPATTGFVLPLSSAVFKMSTMTAEPVRYLFLAHLFGLSLSLPQTATFLLTLAILSFAGVGVPRGGSGFDTLPAFVAAGIPIEGLVLVVAVDTIPDVAKTVINVTGQMAVATLASRGLAKEPG